MILHNQKAAPISWEGGGRKFDWEPYGSCDVPEELVEHLRLEGFPVEVTPVPPKTKATVAADAQLEALRQDEVNQLKAKLDDADARTREAEKSAEAAESRARKSAESEAKAKSDLELAEGKLRTAQSDIAEYEGMLSEANTEITQLKARVLQLESAAEETKEKTKSKRAS